MVITRIVEVVNSTLEPANGPFPAGYPAHLRLFASTSLINAGMVSRDADALQLGGKWATAAIEDPTVSEPMKLAAEYNRANAYTDLVNIRARERMAADPSLTWREHLVAARWEHRSGLAQARAGLSKVGYGPSGQIDAQGRSTALCNLANTLNESGRWLEAYDMYVAALEADPTNGNAAGNAAKLIGKVADSGWGDTPHLHALHDQYLARALHHRARTVELAGESAAQMWDALTPYGCGTELFHAGDPGDPYQGWVTENRLALAPALEGLGANEELWDSAMVRHVRTPMAVTDVPQIFRMLNLLKADFLVARRLAFRAQIMLHEVPFAQHPDDPGRYVDTLDYAAYGEPTSMLVLAQRSALDVLDKLAVAMNDHLGIEDDPSKIYFRKFWTTKDGDLRPEWAAYDAARMGFLSLAELAVDISTNGLYAQSQDLRNIGTHRFVLVHHGWQSIAATGAVVPFTIDDVLASAKRALSVARSAYLYVVATIDTIEHNNATGPTLPMTLPDQIKHHGSIDEPDESLIDTD